MALINTTTTGVLGTTVYGDGQGALTVQKDGVTQGIFGNQPAFSAYRSSSAQSISAGTWTKIQCQTKEFDTNNNYDNSTNYRFTPTVAGYYTISGTIDCSASDAYSSSGLSIYKNGSMFKRGSFSNVGIQQTISSLIYFNGTTDYVELYAFIAGTNTRLGANQENTYFQGILVKAA